MDAGFWAAERLRLGHGRGTALDDYLRHEFGRSDRAALRAGMASAVAGPSAGDRNEVTTVRVRPGTVLPGARRASSS